MGGGGYNKNTIYSIVVFLVVLFSFAFMGASISYAFFTSSANVKGVSFSFAELETLASYGENTDKKAIEINVGSLTTGSYVIENDLKVKTSSDSLSSYIRARVDYKVKSGLSGGSLTNAQMMVIALNSIEVKMGGYGVNDNWKYNATDDCYYLMDGDLLLKVAPNTDYTLFNANAIPFPNLENFNLPLETEEIGTVINNVNLIATFEAVQSENTGITTLDQLSNEMKNLFGETDTTKGYLVTYNSQNGDKIKSTVVIGTENTTITLPKTSTDDSEIIEWYNSTDFIESNKIGESEESIIVNSNLNLYAKYKGETTYFYVYFESNGATSGEMPETKKIEYSESGETIVDFDSNLGKRGYELYDFVIKGGSDLSWSITDKTITIPNNLTQAGRAVTIIPVWSKITFWLRFYPSGGTIVDTSGLVAIDNYYSFYYTIDDVITIPNIEKDGKVASGWKITSASRLWKKNSVYAPGQILSGYYGAAVFEPVFEDEVIESKNVTLSQTTFTYDGTEKKPTVTSILNAKGDVLVEGTDYKILTYANNVNAGTASVIIKLMGNYNGYVEKEFTIYVAVMAIEIDSLSMVGNDNSVGIIEDGLKYVTALGLIAGHTLKSVALEVNVAQRIVKTKNVVIVDGENNDVTKNYLVGYSGGALRYLDVGDFTFTYNETDQTATLTKYNGTDTKLTIPSLCKNDSGKFYVVTTIGVQAFSKCSSLTSVEIPETVTNIEQDAFEYCSSLTTINIPSGVTSLEPGVLSMCTELTSIVIPEGVTVIGSSAFYGSSKLANVTIPNSVKTIGNGAFYNCTNLAQLTIPQSVDEFEEVIFSGTSLINDSNLSVDGMYYLKDENDNDVVLLGVSDKTITTAIVKTGIKFIADSAFDKCKNLTILYMPDSVTAIGWCSFQSCEALESVNIPNGIKIILEYAFRWCRGLKSITIPNGVIEIRSQAFYECDNLESILIPSSVTTIKVNPFMGSKKLANIIVDSGNKVYDSRNNCNAIIETSTNEIKTGGINTKIPSTAKNIGIYAFYDSAMAGEIIILGNIDTIGNYAFENCGNITSVKIESGVKTIGERAFYICTSLLKVDIASSVKTISKQAFENCTELEIKNFEEGLESIGTSAFRNCINSLASVVIPSTVKSIGASAFSECGKLLNITVKAVTPPSATSGSFYANQNMKIYVPSESVEAYKVATGWKFFKSWIFAIS